MLAKDTTDRDGIWTLEPMKIGTSLSTEPLARLSSVLMGCAEEREYREGDVILPEGDIADRLYLIEEGRVALETHVPLRGEIDRP